MSNDDVDECYEESDGQRYKVNSLEDFRKFKELALSNDKAWVTHYSDAVLKVQSKPSDDKSTYLNIIRASRVMERVQPEVLYNQLHDAQYRETWDKNMIKGYNIVQLNENNDIGYYAAKFPWPLANRDFCNMRSWMEFTNGEYIIMNHSVPHKSCPEKKGFVRARSILTGFLIQPYNGPNGTLLTYVTLSDPCGSIPHAIINFAMSKGAPMILNNCEKCTEKYPAYCKATYPVDHVFPRRTAKVDWSGTHTSMNDVHVQQQQQQQQQSLQQSIPNHGLAVDVNSNPPTPVAAATEAEQPVYTRGNLSSTSLLSTTQAALDNLPTLVQTTAPPVAVPPPPLPQSAGSSAIPLSNASPAVSDSVTGPTIAAAPLVGETTAEITLSTSGLAGTHTLSPSLAALHQLDDTVAVQQFRGILQDCIQVVDQTFLREERVPSTREYILRLRYMLHGIRETSIA